MAQSFRSVKWTQLSYHASTRILPSTVAGLHYIQDKRGSNKYFALVHSSSDKVVANWRRGPVKLKDFEFVALVDAAVSPFGIDWTRSQDALEIDEQTGAEIRRATGNVVDFEHGEYRAK